MSAFGLFIAALAMVFEKSLMRNKLHRRTIAPRELSLLRKKMLRRPKKRLF